MMVPARIDETHLKIGLIVILLGILAAIHLIIPDFYSTVWELSTSGNLHGTIDYLRSFRGWAVVISMIIDIVINTVGFLPSIFISTANGVVFGVVGGTIISWIAETIGVVISFFFMRVLFRNKAQKIIEASKMLSKIDQYTTWQAMAVARAVPYSPNGLITALGAVSHISYRDYIIGCLIGKLPSVAIEVLVGHDLVMMEGHSQRLAVVLFAMAIIYGGLWYWKRRRDAREAGLKISEDKPSKDAEK